MNSFLFIVSMILTTILGIFKSDSDEDHSVLHRSWYQFDIDKKVNACVITWYFKTVSEGIYTSKELRVSLFLF